ncbi:histidine kinase [Cereibacter sphaeroides]|uniref:histidine kinase n=1 Tax=Cereibacter sphaeroides TaxID=1063 RepID=UPI001F2B4902|nr:histidine kinase [Cereibacter sphaeroides]MCE6966994.1 histidine kinase [Cereibacter sphaeroides]
MVNDIRRTEMKTYQARRSADRRARGLIPRTVWIRGEDEEAFRQAVARFADHARLLEAVTGGVHLPAIEITEIIRRHALPYDPEDFIFLSRVAEAIALHPLESTRIERRARQIIAHYALPATWEDLQ